jgi:hypothetical protein
VCPRSVWIRTTLAKNRLEAIAHVDRPKPTMKVPNPAAAAAVDRGADQANRTSRGGHDEEAETEDPEEHGDHLVPGLGVLLHLCPLGEELRVADDGPGDGDEPDVAREVDPGPRPARPSTSFGLNVATRLLSW